MELSVSTRSVVSETVTTSLTLPTRSAMLIVADLVYGYGHVIAHHVLKSRSAGRDLVRAGSKRDEGVQACRGGYGRLLHSGGIVEQSHFGRGHDGTGGIGDQAADAASAGLGKSGDCGEEDKGAKAEKIPHGLGTFVPVIHGKFSR